MKNKKIKYEDLCQAAQKQKLEQTINYIQV